MNACKPIQSPTARPPAFGQALPLFRVVVARHHGMCFGVRDAVTEVERLSADGPVTILGQLVHNEMVREKMRGLGVMEAGLDETDVATNRVVFTAHGVSDKDRARWLATGLDVRDTTCPLVHRAHAALRDLVASGYHPVVIGKKGHVEVRGLTGDHPEAVIIESPADLHDLPRSKKIGIVAQTTQPEARVLALVEAVRRLRPESEVVYRDTVCRPTKDRQKALEDLCREATAIVVVGGANSNNTRELVESAKARGCASWRVELPGEIDPQWLSGHEVVGVTAGTSTLPVAVEAVVKRLRALATEPGMPG
ncbi:MAG: 4-hydroxy-3-methylbut-2-enyl diphosphate reductase [Verrucomicrobiales bacterium]